MMMMTMMMTGAYLTADAGVMTGEVFWETCLIFNTFIAIASKTKEYN